MGSQRKLGILIGYEHSSTIKYLEPLIRNVFKGKFVNCHFNNIYSFSSIMGRK